MTGSPGPNLGTTVGWTDHDDHWGDALNDSNLLLDTMVMCAVENTTTTTPPTGVVGKRYIVGTGATGSWSGKDTNIAVFYSGAWVFYPPKVGWRVYNKADNKLYIYTTSNVWANEMSTGFSPFGAQTAWATSTAYTATVPASYVSFNGSSYVCLISHTSGTFATDLAAGKWGPVALAGAANTIYDLSLFIQGVPTPSLLVYKLVIDRPVTLAANMASSVGAVRVNPTATAAFDVRKNGTSIGTVSISTSGVFTFTTVGGASPSFVAGDIVDVVAPGTQDATLQDISITICFTRV